MKQRVLVRFANEMHYVNTIELDPTKLTDIMRFLDEVFATIDDTRIAIRREDFDAFNLDIAN
jgi:hypothetical protein